MVGDLVPDAVGKQARESHGPVDQVCCLLERKLFEIRGHVQARKLRRCLGGERYSRSSRMSIIFARILASLRNTSSPRVEALERPPL